MRKLTTALLCATAITGIALTTFADEGTKTIKWKGCGISKKAFMTEAAKVYEKKTGIEIKISGGGANAGIVAAHEGKADLGGTCRHCTPKLHDWEDELVMTVVAWDGLTIIVHPDNPVASLSLEQVKGIFTGQIKDWSEVGSDPGAIEVFARKAGNLSGVGHMARVLVFEDENFEFGPDVTLYKSSSPLEAKLEDSKNAIGFTGISSARLRDLKAVAIDGFEPTQANIASGAYPYFRPLYLAHKVDLRPEVQDFIDWLLSDEGQAVVDSQGTVTLAQGAELATKYAHWQEAKYVVNYDDLMQQAVAAVPTN